METAVEVVSVMVASEPATAVEPMVGALYLDTYLTLLLLLLRDVAR